jgi:hypothetical protein
LNAPVPAFAAPFPSMIEPAQSTVTVRENVAILDLRSRSKIVNPNRQSQSSIPIANPQSSIQIRSRHPAIRNRFYCFPRFPALARS